MRARVLVKILCQLFLENKLSCYLKLFSDMAFRAQSTFMQVRSIYRTFFLLPSIGTNMVIEKVHGLQATSVSLNDRFTMLTAAAPDRFVPRPRRRPSVNSYFNQNMNYNNRNFVHQIARRLEMEVKKVCVMKIPV